MSFSILSRNFSRAALLLTAAAALNLPVAAAANKPVLMQAPVVAATQSGGIQALELTLSALGHTLGAGAADRFHQGFGIESSAARELLSEGSFGWAPQAAPAMGGQWDLGGRSALGRFGGESRQGVSVAGGRVVQVNMELDYRGASGAAAGFTLGRSSGRSQYESMDIPGRGEVTAAMTSVYSYGRWTPRAGLDLWGLAGLGRGQMELIDAERSVERTGLGLRMAAVGARQGLLTVGGIGVAARADAFAVRLETDESMELPGMETGAQRARLLLEGAGQWNLSPGSWLAPVVEAGPRYDRGAGESALGAEVGGCLHYVHEYYGLDLELRGRRLLAARDTAFEDWGASLLLRLAPGGRRGLAVELEPAWGPEAGLESESALWPAGGSRAGAEGPRESLAAPGAPEHAELKLSYGLEGRGGLLTPFGALGLGADERRLRLGARLAASAAADDGGLELFAERLTRAGEAPERRVGLQATVTY